MVQEMESKVETGIVLDVDENYVEVPITAAAARDSLEWLLLGKIRQLTDADLIGGVNIRIDCEMPRPTLDIQWGRGRRFYCTIEGKHRVPKVIESR